MKRFFALLLALCLTLSLAGCIGIGGKSASGSSGSSAATQLVAPTNDAEKAAAAFFDAFLAMDFQTAATYLKDGKSLETAELPDDETLRSFVDMVCASTHYEILYSTITGDAATVAVKIEMVNLAEFVTDFVKSLLGDIVLKRDLSPEAIRQKFHDAVNAKDRKQMTFDTALTLEKVDGEWRISSAEDFIETFEKEVKNGNLFDILDVFS